MNRPGYLRFDFQYGDQLTAEQLSRIEDIANAAVDSDYKVNTIETSLKRHAPWALWLSSAKTTAMKCAW